MIHHQHLGATTINYFISFSYHNLLLTLYQPFTAETDRVQAPQTFVSNATKHIHTLIRKYYLRHSFEATDEFLTQPLALTGFACLSQINDEMPKDELEAGRAMLFLATKGLRGQGRNFYVAEPVCRVIEGQMRHEEAALMRSIASVEDGGAEAKQSKLHAVHSSWPVSIVSKSKDLKMTKLTQLVEWFVSTGSSTRRDHASDSEHESSQAA